MNTTPDDARRRLSQSELKGLRGEFADGDDEERLAAAGVLALHGHLAEVLPYFVAILENGANQPLDVVNQVHTALEELGLAAAPAAAALAGNLFIPVLDVCESAARALISILGDQATEPLLQALQHTEPVVRQNAARFLGEIGSSASRIFEPLSRRLLHDPAPQVRRNAVDALVRVASDPTLTGPVLEAALQDPDAETRQRAAACLICLQPQHSGAIAVVREVLASRDPEVLWTLQILAKGVGPSADALISDVLAVIRTRPLEGTIGRFAGLALGRLGTAAVGPLLEVLGEPDLQRHNAVMWAFTVLGPQARAAIPALLRILNEKPRYECAPEPEDYRGIYVAWGVPNLAVEALASIVGQEDTETIPAFVTALGWENELARRAAAEGLGRIGPAARNAEAALKRALTDTSQAVRLAAREALAEIGA